MHTAELDMANSLDPNDIGNFLNNVAWVVCSTYHAVLKATPGTTIFGWDMLFNIPFVADGETTGSTRLIAAQSVRTQNKLIGIMQLVTKC